MRKIYLEGMLGEKFGSEWNLAVSSPAEAMQAISAQRPGFKQFLMEGENIQGYDVLVGEEQVSLQECLLSDPNMNQSYTFAPIIAGSKNAGILMVLGIALIAMTGGAAAIFGAGMGGAATGTAAAASTIATSTATGAALTTAAGAAGFSGVAGANALMSLGGMSASAAAAAAGTTTTAMYAMAGAQYLGMGLLLGGASMMLAPDTPDGNTAKQAENYLFSGPINTTKQGAPIPLIYGRIITGSATIMGSLFTSSSRSESAVSGNRKLVGIGGFRNDGDSHGENAPAGRYGGGIDPGQHGR
jgi:predicted phage tail protein